MKATWWSNWGPVIAAFTIWFAHFMVSWAAAEIWPHRWPANAVGWGATGVALLALGVHAVQMRKQHAAGALPGWQFRFAQGAAAIAATAVMFGLLPSIVFLP